jgi:hypothetical protein
MFVTLKVFKLIGPSNDGQRHGRGTYLFYKIKSVILVQLFARMFLEHHQRSFAG